MFQISQIVWGILLGFCLNLGMPGIGMTMHKHPHSKTLVDLSFFFYCVTTCFQKINIIHQLVLN